MGKASVVISRTNYRTTGQKISSEYVARGEFTPSSPVVTDATHSSIIYVSTGLASPAYAVALMAQSQTGMTSKREVRFIGATGSYLKFLGVIATTSGRYGLVSSTTTFEFTWLAWEE